MKTILVDTISAIGIFAAIWFTFGLVVITEPNAKSLSCYEDFGYKYFLENIVRPIFGN